MRIFNLYLFLALTLSFLSCDKEDEPIPAYIKINPITLTTTNDQGSDSENIEYAFLYVDDEFIGGFFIPSTIPVLKSGNVDIIIDPGVKANGVSFNPDIYPFYKRYETNIRLNPGEITEISATTTYRDNAKFPILEEFESANHIFTDDIDGNTATAINITSDMAFEGSSGVIRLDTDNPNIIFGSDFSRNDLSELPKNGTPVWLEINYKTDTEVLFGLVGYDALGFPESYPEYGVNPSAEWKKIYFDLSQFIFDERFVAFQIIGASSNREGRSESFIYLDNIKLLYFDL
jgi:hypothetical protein